MKNLFDYATKELSQDAFLMWLLESYNEQDIEADVREAAIELLHEFGIPVQAEDIIELWTKGQWCKMDISVHITTKTKKYGLYIEDKTVSTEHNQLEAYNKSIQRIQKNDHIDDVIRIYYKTSLMTEAERKKVQAADWTEFEFHRIVKFWEKYTNSKNLILNNYANHICKIGEDSFTVTRPLDNNPTAWKSYFDRVICPNLEGKYWYETKITRFGYACLMIEPLGFPDNSPYLEIRSRDCLNNTFTAKILVYGVKDSRNRDYVAEIRKNIKEREKNDIFKGNYGEKHNKQLGKTPKDKYNNITTDEQFIDVLTKSINEFCEIVKFWAE